MSASQAVRQQTVEDFGNQWQIHGEVDADHWSSRDMFVDHFGDLFDPAALAQGCAADIMKFAMSRIWRYLKDHHCKSRIIMTIHDEIVLEIHKSEEKRLVPRIRKLMEQDSDRFWVPMTSDIESP